MTGDRLRAEREEINRLRAENKQLWGLLREHANEGDRINHAWAYICRYCGRCSDAQLEHDVGCPVFDPPPVEYKDEQI